MTNIEDENAGMEFYKRAVDWTPSDNLASLIQNDLEDDGSISVSKALTLILNIEDEQILAECLIQYFQGGYEKRGNYFEDIEINKETINEAFTDLLVTDVINTVDAPVEESTCPFKNYCTNCNTCFSSHQDYIEHLNTLHEGSNEGIGRTDHLDIMSWFDQKGLHINRIPIGDKELFHCCHLDCEFFTDDRDKLHRHIEETHNAVPYLTDLYQILREYAIKFKRIPRMKDIFKPIRLSYATTNNETQSDVIIIGQRNHDDFEQKADVLSDIITRRNSEDIEPRYELIPGLPFATFISELSTINANTFEYGENLFEWEDTYRFYDPELSITDQHLVRLFTQRTDNSAPPSAEERNLEVSSVDIFNSFCERIIAVFGGDLDKTTIIEFIEDCRHTNIIPDDTFPAQEEWPLLAAFILESHWLPSLGYSSPLPGDTRTFDTNAKLKEYIKTKVEPHLWGIPTEQMYLWATLGKGRYGFKYGEDNKIYDKCIGTCIFECEDNYICSGEIPDKHLNGSQHKGVRDLIKEYGPFYAYIIHEAQNERQLTAGTAMRDRVAHICPRCHDPFGKASSIKNHTNINHPDAPRVAKGVDIPHDTVTLEWICEEDLRNAFDEEQHILEQAEEERRRNAMRPINTVPQALAVTERRAQARTDERYEHEMLNPVPEPRELDQESNAQLIEAASVWLEESNNMINENRKVPALTKNTRKKVVIGLKNLYSSQIIPMLIEYMPFDDSENEKIKFDGAVYHAFDLLYHHVCDTLVVSGRQTVEGSRNARNRDNTQKQNDINAKRSDRADSIFTIRRIREINQLANTEDKTLQEENRLNDLITDIEAVVSRHDHKWVTTVFGEGTREGILNTCSTSDKDVFERKIKWLEAKLCEEYTTDAQKKRIIEKFEDNPAKTLKQDIFPENTPECQVSAQQFAEAYGPGWSQQNETYQNFVKDDWGIDRVFGGEFNDSFPNFMTNPKEIRPIIESRNFLSACGLDGVGNALFRLVPALSTKMFQIIFQGIITTRHVPKCWKMSKTCFIYKKGDPTIPKNWRPIGITTCAYRIFTAMLTRCFQRTKPFHRYQKGFTTGGSTTDHIVTLNEITKNSMRKGEDLYITTVDFANAFGSVPQQMIFDALEAKGLCKEIIEIIRSIYDNNKTTCMSNSGCSEPIQWNCGVLQGCPLSPLLFNSCIDALLSRIERYNYIDGVQIGTDEGRSIYIPAQAYADDIVLISSSRQGMERLLSTLSDFQDLSSIQVAPHKCTTLARIESNAQRTPFIFKGEEIPISSSFESISYLGAKISGVRNTTLENGRNVADNLKEQIIALFNSPLTSSQKIVALRSYLIPKLEYTMANGEIPVKTLVKLNEKIRGLVAKELHLISVPIDFYYSSTSLGGLGIPDLKAKQDLEKIIQFTRLATSNDETSRMFIQQMTLDEERFRKVVKVDTDEENAHFNDWKMEDGIIAQESDHMTSCAAVKAASSANRLNLQLSAEPSYVKLREFSDDPQIMYFWNVIKKPKDARKQVNQLVRTRHFENLQKDRTHGHAFIETKIKESHAVTSNPEGINNNLYKFTIGARVNCLATPANVSFHNGHQSSPDCPVCHSPSHYNK